MKRNNSNNRFENSTNGNELPVADVLNEGTISKNDYYIAYKRVKRIKGFYIHLLVYVLVNLFLIVSQIVEAHSSTILFKMPTYATAFFWGIGLVGHGLSVFGTLYFFSSKWEEKKIKEIMDKEASKF